MTRRGLNLLKASFVAGAPAGRHADGGGLYLLVRRRGQVLERLWLFRWRRGPRGAEQEATLSLGPARDVPLVRARQVAAKAREALAAGEDPRRALRAGVTATFAEVADAYVEAIGPGLRNAKHVGQWRMTLGPVYCRSLRPLAVDRIATEDVLAVLKPVWAARPETAQRLRGRIERVLDAATVQGLRAGANPARWRGHLAHLLSRPASLTRGHHAAVPWPDMPATIARVRELGSVSAAALEFTILTCARTGETIGATWSEIDLERRVWTVPAERTKMRREHRVPLGARALELLEEMRALGGGYVFPGRNLKRPLSNMAMMQCLRHVRAGVTVHGFRSSFRDWVGEATSFSELLAEAALAHQVGSKVERAYRRGDALERRRELMAAWEHFCDPAAGSNVTPIRRGR